MDTVDSDYFSNVRGDVGNPNDLPTVSKPVARTLPTDDMPPCVRQAVEYGATVDLQSRPFKVLDDCGCCYTVYMAGWYKLLPLGSRKIICGADGEPVDCDNEYGIIGSIEGRWNP